MSRAVLGVLLVFYSLLSAVAQDGVAKGKIKKLDAGQGVLTLATPDGKDRNLTVLPNTRIMGADGSPLKDGLKDPRFKEGAMVTFKTIQKDGKELLVGLRLGGPAKGAPKEIAKVDTSKLKPLTDMGDAEYQGFKGGLYPDGKNEPPPAHLKAGRAVAKTIQPLDAQGKPSAGGKIVLLSVGMSNTTMVFSVFKKTADADPEKNPMLIVVDGAQSGLTAFRTQYPDDKADGTKYWSISDQRLKNAGVTPAQVQAVWMKQADAYPTTGFPKYATTLQAEMTRIIQHLPKRFPNIKLAHLSSRTYGGYARTGLNPEPYAFESGLSVRWMIEQQLKGDAGMNFDPAKGPVTAPWLGWGPYLWANGMSKRADGFYYEEGDFRASDGTHPSANGCRKIAEQLMQFYKNDATTRGWFVRAK